MTITVRDESATYIAGWWTRKGERYISRWLTTPEREQRWFNGKMIERFGRNWNKTDD